jgi:hypothetical protein
MLKWVGGTVLDCSTGECDAHKLYKSTVVLVSCQKRKLVLECKQTTGFAVYVDSAQSYKQRAAPGVSPCLRPYLGLGPSGHSGHDPSGHHGTHQVALSSPAESKQGAGYQAQHHDGAAGQDMHVHHSMQ